MRVFLTGATGFIGSAVIPELLQAGHQVVGLTRSEAGARQMAVAGADSHRGSLEDPDSLRAGAAQADGVIHCAFDHDFENFLANCDKDRRAIEALASALVGTDRPLVITSGAGMGSPGDGRPAVEDVFNLEHPNPRSASEVAGQAALATGVNVSVMRLPQVHDPVKQGLITPAVEIRPREGRLGLCRRRGQSLGRGPCPGRRPPLPAGAGARQARRPLPRGGRGGRDSPRDRRGGRRRVEGSGGVPDAGGGGGPFWLDGPVHHPGHAGLERLDATGTGLDPDRAEPD